METPNWGLIAVAVIFGLLLFFIGAARSSPAPKKKQDESQAPAPGAGAPLPRQATFTPPRGEKPRHPAAGSGSRTIVVDPEREKTIDEKIRDSFKF